VWHNKSIEHEMRANEMEEIKLSPKTCLMQRYGRSVNGRIALMNTVTIIKNNLFKL
jgi:hypothetical protein